MNVEYTSKFQKKLKKRVKRNSLLAKKISNTIRLLKVDWKHSSLRTHKLKGNRYHQYAIRVEGDVRIICSLEDDTLILLDIINHDEYRLSTWTQ